MTDYKALCAELLAGADEYTGMNPYMRLDNAMKAARAALAAEPEPPDTGEVAELVNHLLKVAAEDESDGCTYDSAFTRRAAELLERLDEPGVVEPTDEELEKLADDYMAMDGATGVMCLGHIDFARAVLARWGQ